MPEGYPDDELHGLALEGETLLIKGALKKLISEWENTICWHRAHAEEHMFIHDCPSTPAWEKAHNKTCMNHYDGCIRQIERCIKDIQPILT